MEGDAVKPGENRQEPGRKGIWTVGTLSYSSAGLVLLFSWLLFGDFAWNSRERAVTPLAQLMLKAGGASDTIIGLLAASLPAALGMFVAPVVGYRSDRYRSRFGRRIPFLIVSTPLAAAAMVGIAFAPAAGSWLDRLLGASSPGEPLCFLVFFCACWIVFEVAAIIGNSLFLALINDVVPREILGRFFGLFRAVSLGVGVLFNFFLMGKAETYLFEMLVVLALVYGIGFGLMCLRVKEGEYPPVPDEEAHEGFADSLRRYWRECFTHRYYLWLFGALAIAQVAFAPVNTFAIFYAKSVGLSMDSYGKALAASFMISLAISYSIGALADRIHPLRVAIASLILYLGLCIWAMFGAVSPNAFAVAFIGHVVITGIFFTGTASAGQRLFPKEKFAQFASAAQLVFGLCTMLLPPAMGLILDLSGHLYQLTFVVGGLFSVAALVFFFIVLRFYKHLGGDAAYSPP